MSIRIPPAEERFEHRVGPLVHSILKNEWDPIGFWTPADEYDDFVGPLIAKITAGDSINAVADYLDWACNDHIGCPLPREKNLEIARKLCALRPA